VHGKAAKALSEGFGVLACKQRGRHDHRDLSAVHRGHEGRTQRYFGLTEANVAADQPIHGPSGGEFTQHRVNRRLLIFGLLVRKSCAELVIKAVSDRELRRLAQLPLGRDLDQLIGDVADAALHARLARLPGAAAEPVELNLRFFRPVAGQQLDIFDREEQFVAARIVDFETIVRCAGGFDRAQPDEAPDAVIDMDDEIAGGEARHLGDEILRPARGAARPHQAIAQNVLLADHRRLGGFESAFEPEHRERDL